MINEKQIHSYIGKVNALLPIHSKNEKRYIKELADSITEFTESNPNATEQNIIDAYGSLADVVHDYLSSYDIDVLVKRISILGFIKKAIAITLVVVLATFAGFMHKAYLDSKNSIVTNTETTIEDE